VLAVPISSSQGTFSFSDMSLFYGGEGAVLGFRQVLLPSEPLHQPGLSLFIDYFA
jgi:hypothetical protein